MENITIRKATERDLVPIFNLIRQLAIYEYAEKDVVVTLPELKEDFNNKVFQAHVAIAEGEVIGMVLYYMTYSTWKGKMLYLDDFVVTESYRRTGVGKMLFDQVLDIAREWNCRLVKLQVLDWNKNAIRFYKKYNADIETEWYNAKIFLDKVKRK